MARPRPAPFMPFSSTPSAYSNGWPSRCNAFALMPGPLSATKRNRDPARRRARRRTAPPAGVNFRLLEISAPSARSSAAASPRHGRSLPVSTISSRFFACARARHVQPDVSSDEEDGENGQECDTEEQPEHDAALLTDDKLLDLFLKKQKRLDQEATNTGLTSSTNSLARAVNGADSGAGGDKGPLTPPPRPTPALQSMITPRGGVDPREDTKTNPQLSVQARALLSPRLPEVCLTDTTNQYLPRTNIWSEGGQGVLGS